MINYNSKEILDYIIECRRYLHSVPELGGDLPKTSEFVINELNKLKNIEYKRNKKDSGIIAFINGKKFDLEKQVALRADMDALPIVEETDFDYKSTNCNMHACGHDVHTAMLLGVCKILNDNVDNFGGCIKFIFQTGEETGTGAKIMIEENALENVEAIVGVHVGSFTPDISNGIFVIQEGPILASTDKITIKVKGKGAHGAYPHAGVDPIIMSAEIINSLQSVLTREVNAAETVVFSLCKINGGTAFNIIPDIVEIEGTLRTLSNEVRDFVIKRIEEKAKLVAASMNGECEIIIEEYARTTFSNADIVKSIKNTAAHLFSDSDVWHEKINPSMGGEDFSYYLDYVKGCFILFSTITDKKIPNHNSKFEVDESKINMPAELMANWAVEYLNSLK